MKKTICAVLLAIGLVSCTAQKENISPEALSEKLLSVTLEPTELKKILKKHEGKPILIEVWASWCGDCVKAMPLLKETQAKFPDVAYVFVSMDKTPEKWKEGITKHSLVGDHYFAPDGMKGSFGKAINVDWIPRYMILEKKGKVVVYRAIEKDFDMINSTLEKL
jgi:thiol-disulfide isomerase/thioredoxin